MGPAGLSSPKILQATIFGALKSPSPIHQNLLDLAMLCC